MREAEATGNIARVLAMFHFRYPSRITGMAAIGRE